MPDKALDPVTSAAATAELQQLLLATDGIDDFLQQLAHLAAATLPGELSCGITMRLDRRPITAAGSDDRASQVDEIQYSHERGPCFTSLANGEVVQIEDLAADDRWPDYQIPRSPTESVLRCPAALRRAEGCRRAEPVRDPAAAKTGAPPTRRLKILRATSQNRNVKLRDIAVALVIAVSGQSRPRRPASAELNAGRSCCARRALDERAEQRAAVVVVGSGFGAGSGIGTCPTWADTKVARVGPHWPSLLFVNVW